MAAALLLLPATAFAAEGDWTYDSQERTLINEDKTVTLQEVTHSGNQLTIGSQNGSISGELDLSGTITGTDGITTYTILAIGESAFYHCQNLNSVKLPDGLETIGYGTFNFCTSLSSINIPESVKTIGAHSFTLCSSLWSIDIPEGVESIGEFAFAQCPFVSVTIPKSVTSIGYLAFSSPSGSLSITLLSETPPTIATDAFGSGRLIERFKRALMEAWAGKFELDLRQEDVRAVASFMASGIVGLLGEQAGKPCDEHFDRCLQIISEVFSSSAIEFAHNKSKIGSE